MAKFVFKMENILNVKIQLENQQRLNFGLAMARVNEEEEKLDALIQRRIAYENETRNLVSGKLRIADIKANKDSINVIKSLIRTQMIEVSTARKTLELARKQLNDAIVERKTYEKLKEKAFEEFKREINYEENKITDEIVSYRYHATED